jgi:hypothetical protein
MGWKKPTDPVDVTFFARTTRAERDAIDAMIARWSEKQIAGGASAGGVTMIAWFRQTMRRLAAEEGIPVHDPPPPTPVTPKSTKAPKGGKKKPRRLA